MEGHKTFDYKVIKGGITPEELNALGADGFELVAVTTTGGQYKYVFKRELFMSEREKLLALLSRGKEFSVPGAEKDPAT